MIPKISRGWILYTIMTVFYLVSLLYLFGMVADQDKSYSEFFMENVCLPRDTTIIFSPTYAYNQFVIWNGTDFVYSEVESFNDSAFFSWVAKNSS